MCAIAGYASLAGGALPVGAVTGGAARRRRWLTGQRVLLAQRLLEETEHGVNQVAARAGFGNAMTLRHHFRAWRGTTPAAYRSTFRSRERQAARACPANP